MENRRTRLLFCAVEHDYGDPSRGPSYERTQFEPTLKQIDLELRTFAFDREIDAHGYFLAMQNLWRIVEEWQPDVMLCFMYEEQLSRDLITRISNETPTTTAAWFADDQWRFEGYSRHWATAFNWVLTTDARAVDKYRAAGQPNVVLTQWGCNHLDFHPTGRAPRRDVAFVGHPYGHRRATIEYLRRHGVAVETWGRGWPNGQISFPEMVGVFAESRINLNFSAGSERSLLGLGSPTSMQIKGRVFEVPGCGGLLLTDYAEDLERYYEPDREIVVFKNRRDLLGKINYLLAHESERAEIASAGYRRTIRDHTYEARFRSIFEALGHPLDGPPS